MKKKLKKEILLINKVIVKKNKRKFNLKEKLKLKKN